MSADGEPNGSSVRITNVDIYKLLIETDRRVASLEQTFREVVEPKLNESKRRLDQMDKEKADGALVKEVRSKMDKLEIRNYAILGGLVVAALGGRALGVI